MLEAAEAAAAASGEGIQTCSGTEITDPSEKCNTYVQASVGTQCDEYYIRNEGKYYKCELGTEDNCVISQEMCKHPMIV